MQVDGAFTLTPALSLERGREFDSSPPAGERLGEGESRLAIGMQVDGVFTLTPALPLERGREFDSSPRRGEVG